MECNENIKDSRNQEILTYIKCEGDSLKKYNNKEVKSEIDEHHFESSYGQESLLDEYCSNDIKIENHVLEDVSNEIKVEIKKEPEHHFESSYGQESLLDDYCSDDIKIENHVLEHVSNEIKDEIKKEPADYSIGRKLISLHF
ncbi:unnamed protein product [Diabrotica balteata]|uniref:Uncharacterized protein n=1 Tax=Diabrotica balteata TaxID=107213 RepID=A0A9N9T9L6_DIABA|nr:unnamed protein product [Diabrotica balteata]